MIAIRRASVAAVLAALAMGLTELGLLALRADLGGPTAGITLGIWLALAPLLFLAGLAGILLSGLTPVRALGAALNAPDWSVPFARLTGAGLGLLAALLVIPIGLRLVLGGLKDPSLLPPLAVVVVLMALGGGGLLGLLAVGGLRALFRRLPRRGAMFGALGGGLILLIAALRPAWRLLFVARSAAPVWLLLGAVVLTLLLMRRRWGWTATILAWAGIAGGALLGGRLLVQHPETLDPIARTDAMAQRGVALVKRLTDGDRDGFSRLVGQRDCNDADPSVHPFAADLPANRIDEDCDGKDAPLQTLRREPVAHAPLPKALRRKWNVLLITIDTLRPDHLGVYGYDRPVSPQIDKLAKDAFVFDPVWAAASKTADSVPALMTGRYLSELNTDRRSTPVWILPENDLLAERFNAAGWFTQGAMIKQFTEMFWFGMTQGLEVVHAPNMGFGAASAPTLVDAVIKGLDDKAAAGDPRPFFTWLHMHEPHAGYVKHDGFDFGDSDVDRYDSEIAFVDHQIGRLMQALRDRDQFHNTIIAITSDHGESFHEHGEPYHGRSLWDEASRIPLIIRVPKLKGRHITTPTSLVDVPETLANLTSLTPGDGPSATSLVPLMLRKAAPKGDPRAIWIDSFLEQDAPEKRLLARIEWPYKMVMDFRTGRATLFNLDTDPGERIDLSATEPARAARFKTALRERMAYYNQGEVLRAITPRRHPEPPPGVPLAGVPSDGVPLAPGVVWLGGEIVPTEKARFRLVRNWFRATGEHRGDYTVRLDLKAKQGKWRYKKDRRPVMGRYPTHRWQTGEIIEDLRWIKIRGKGPFMGSVGLVRGGKVRGGMHALTVRSGDRKRNKSK